LKIETLPGTKVKAITRLQQLMENHDRILDLVCIIHWSEPDGEPGGWAITHTTMTTEAIAMATIAMTSNTHAIMEENFNPDKPGIRPE
jgi:hypothetical protein